MSAIESATDALILTTKKSVIFIYVSFCVCVGFI